MEVNHRAVIRRDVTMDPHLLQPFEHGASILLSSGSGVGGAELRCIKLSTTRKIQCLLGDFYSFVDRASVTKHPCKRHEAVRKLGHGFKHAAKRRDRFVKPPCLV